MFNWVTDAIKAAINSLLWQMVKCICCMLNFITDIIDFLANKIVMSIFFGTEGTDFTKAHITPAFRNFMLVAVLLWIVFFVVTLLNFFFKDMQECDDTPLSKKIFNSLKQSSIGLVIVMMVPFLIFLLFWFVQNFEKLFLMAITNTTGEEFKLGDAIIVIGQPSGADYVTHIDLTTSGLGRYPEPSNIGDWNMFLELVGLLFILLNVLLVLISLSETLYNMFFMFILTAIYAFSAVFDNGNRMKQYAKSMIANSLVVASTMAVFGLYVSLLQTINTTIKSSSSLPWEAVGLLKLAIAVGGASFILSANESIISRLVGENIAGLSKAKNNLSSMVSSVFGAGLMVKSAAKTATRFGFGKKNNEKLWNKGKKGTGGLGSSLGSEGGGSEGSSGETQKPFDHNEYDEKGGFRGHFKQQAAKKAQATKQKFHLGGASGLAARAVRGAMKSAVVTKNVVASPFSVKARAQLVETTHNLSHNIGKKVAVGAGAVTGTLTGFLAGVAGYNEYKAAKEKKEHLASTRETTVSQVDGIYEKASNKLKSKIERKGGKIKKKEITGKWKAEKVKVEKAKQKVRKRNLREINDDRKTRKNRFEEKTGRKLD